MTWKYLKKKSIFRLPSWVFTIESTRLPGRRSTSLRAGVQMSQALSPAEELARRLLTTEAAGRTRPDELAAATQRLCQYLRGCLVDWIGIEGYHALVIRALKRAASQH